MLVNSNIIKMKHTFFVVIIALLTACTATQESSFSTEPQSVVQPDYDTFFTPHRLRIDLVFAGNTQYQKVFLASLAKEDNWSGSRTNMVDTFEYGEYYMKVKSKEGQTIYSRGFNTLFQEWRCTPEANINEQSYCSSYVIPYPKDTIELCIYERVKQTGKYNELYSAIINPNDKLISSEKCNNFNVEALMHNGDCKDKVDLLFIAEGYTKEQMDKFRADAQRMTDYMFSMHPYSKHKEDFNIWIVESLSAEEGTDIPHMDVWKNTVADSHFYTFYSDRYLTAPNHTTICKIASNAPYDALYVLVNDATYGGGGIYNFYGLSSSDNKWAEPVFIHEFGHSFAGLGDEYFDSSTSYDETFYNLDIEPWEPNITTLVNFESKWKDMLNPDVQIPTPDSDEPQVLGVYEGGGYMAKGVYRPVMDCRMKTNTAPGFCPVCSRAIERMIEFYTK